jgi:hypothetical protein
VTHSLLIALRDAPLHSLYLGDPEAALRADPCVPVQRDGR